jgi:16S rRNA (guanine527-N7)-methyltransferase
MLPRVRVTLVEPMARRTAFLLECAAALNLGNVQVRRARAEDLAGEVQADVVTSRAVASLDRLAALAAGLARPGGLVLAIKGAAA